MKGPREGFDFQFNFNKALKAVQNGQPISGSKDPWTAMTPSSGWMPSTAGSSAMDVMKTELFTLSWD